MIVSPILWAFAWPRTAAKVCWGTERIWTSYGMATSFTYWLLSDIRTPHTLHRPSQVSSAVWYDLDIPAFLIARNVADAPDVVQTRQSIGCAGKKRCVSCTD